MRLRMILLSVAISISIPADHSVAVFGPTCAHPTRLPDARPWTVANIVDAFGQPSDITETQASRYFYERDGCTFVATIENGEIQNFEFEPERPCIHAFPARHQPPTWFGGSVQDLVKTFGQPDSRQEDILVTRLFYSRSGCHAMATAEDGVVSSIVNFGGSEGAQGCQCPEAR